MISSSFSARVSMSFSRHSRAASAWSFGIETVSYVEPLSSVCQSRPFIVTRSSTPLKSLSTPHGSCSDERRGVEPVDHHVDAAVELRADAVHLVDEADPRYAVPVGLPPDRLALRLDTGDGVEDRDRAVEHSQRALDLDREVDVAGVSMMLMVWSFHSQVVAAEVMVMPRSCSCSIQSMTAAPSWTSPIL